MVNQDMKVHCAFMLLDYFFICILGDVMLFEVLLLTVIHFGDEKHVETFRGKQYFS